MNLKTRLLSFTKHLGSTTAESPTTRNQRYSFQFEKLEDRNMLSGDSVLIQAHGDFVEGTPQEVIERIESLVYEGPLTPPGWNPDHTNDPLTVILDFNDPGQPNTTDIFGNVVADFDVTIYGFAASQYNTVTQSILDKVQNEHYLGILTDDIFPQSPIPAGQELAIEFEIGDFGTPPANGSNNYYYIQIGDYISGGCGGALGCAGINSIRSAGGNPGIVGRMIGSTFSDVIRTIGGLNPPNALSSGNLFFTTNAVAGTTSHEIGHGLSLNHLAKNGSVTPTGLPPIMGTGAIDLPNQDRIQNREFALSGVNPQIGGQQQFHLQQLVGAIGLHSTEPSLAEILDNGDPGFSLAGPGVWNNFTNGGFQNDINWTEAGDGDTATWSFTVDPGDYQVSATWFNHPTLATDSPFEIFDGATSLGVFNVDQTVAPSQFNDAGATWDDLASSVTISSGTLTVVLDDGASGRVAADAIRIEPVDPFAPQVIDNGDAGYAAVSGGGVWNTFGAGFQGDIDWTEPGDGDTASWTFSVNPGADFQVSATWFAHPTLATDSPFEIFDGAVSLGTFNVDQTSSPSQFSEGGVFWDDLAASVTISSGTLVVELSDIAAGRVGADAIRVQEIAPPDLDGFVANVNGPNQGIVDSAFATFEDRFSFEPNIQVPASVTSAPVTPQVVNENSSVEPVVTNGQRTRMTFTPVEVRNVTESPSEPIETSLNVPINVGEE